MLPIDPARPKVLAESLLSGEDSLALSFLLNNFFRLIFKLTARFPKSAPEPHGV